MSFPLVIALLLLSPTALSAAQDSNGESALHRFVLDVLAANPTVLEAKAQAEASQALELAASRPLYNPEISLQAEDAEEKTLAIGVEQAVQWRGKRGARELVAQTKRLVTEAKYRQIRQEVALEILSELSDYLILAERRELTNQQFDLMSRFAELAQRYYAAGDMSLLDFDLAILARGEARISQADAAIVYTKAQGRLQGLTGVSHPASAWPDIDFPLPDLQGESDLARLLPQLPEVVAANRESKAAQALVELARLERLSDPNLSLTAGKEGDENMIAFEVSLALPILNPLRHEVSAAVHSLVATQKSADEVKQRAYARLQVAADSYKISREAWLEWLSRESVDIDRHTDLLLRLWNAGELSTGDYVLFMHRTLEVHDKAIELKLAAWKAWFEWLAASGQIEDWLVGAQSR